MHHNTDITSTVSFIPLLPNTGYQALNLSNILTVMKPILLDFCFLFFMGYLDLFALSS